MAIRASERSLHVARDARAGNVLLRIAGRERRARTCRMVNRLHDVLGESVALVARLHNCWLWRIRSGDRALVGIVTSSAVQVLCGIVQVLAELAAVCAGDLDGKIAGVLGILDQSAGEAPV